MFSITYLVSVALGGSEVHRDAATHANPWRRKANRLLILFIQEVLELELQAQDPDRPDVLEHRVGARQIDERKAGQRHPWRARPREISVDGRAHHIGGERRGQRCRWS